MYTYTCRLTMVHFEVQRLCNTYSDEVGTWEGDKMKGQENGCFVAVCIIQHLSPGWQR